MKDQAKGKNNRAHAPPPSRSVKLEPPAMGHRHLFDDGQAEAGADDIAGILAPGEAFGEPRLRLSGKAPPPVGDLDPRLGAGDQGQVDLGFVGRILDRVVEKVPERRLDQRPVAPYRHLPIGSGDADRQVLEVGGGAECLGLRLDQLREVEAFVGHPVGAVDDRRVIQKLPGGAAAFLDCPDHGAKRVAGFFGVALPHRDLGPCPHRGQGRADVVRGLGDEGFGTAESTPQPGDEAVERGQTAGASSAGRRVIDGAQVLRAAPADAHRRAG